MATPNPEDPPRPEIAPAEIAPADTYILDASAAVEYLLDRPAGVQVAAMIAGARLIAPEMLDAEVMSGLRSQVLHGEIDEARALTALADLAAMPVERVSHGPLIPLAWPYYQNVTAYDALYVAAARVYDAAILTCDGHLSRAPAGVLGVAVRNVDVG